MKLPAFLRGKGQAEEQPEPGHTILAPVETAQRTPREKIDFHVIRFQRALAQCEKGEERMNELQQNLDYWLALQQADDLKKGVK